MCQCSLHQDRYNGFQFLLFPVNLGFSFLELIERSFLVFLYDFCVMCPLMGPERSFGRPRAFVWRPITPSRFLRKKKCSQEKVFARPEIALFRMPTAASFCTGNYQHSQSFTRFSHFICYFECGWMATAVIFFTQVIEKNAVSCEM